MDYIEMEIANSFQGERLPTFPSPTHPVTIAQALSTIRPRSTHHNVDEVLARALGNPRFPRPPYDPNVLLRHTITTAGGDCHPSGERMFTPREFAALQGFPSHHRFAGRAIRRQIGNAFPPTSVKVLYDHIRNWLLKEDGIKGEDEEQANVDDDIIMVDWRERSATLPLE